MPFSPYHFISLTEEQRRQRRDALDYRGYYAQCATLLTIIIPSLYRKYLWNHGPVEGKHQKPSRRAERSWWDSPPVPGWRETRSQYLIVLLWLGVLLGLCSWNTGDDYLHLTKALGHVAMSQVPVQVLMSPVSYIITSRAASPSVVSVVTSISQPELTPYHRLFGRVVLSPLIFSHAALYIFFFLQTSHSEYSSLFWKRIRDYDVQCGVAALSAVIGLVLLLRPTFQNRGMKLFLGASSFKTRRQIFYPLHLTLVTVMAVAAYLHVSHARMFVLESLGSFMLNVVCCWVPQSWLGM